MKLNLPLLALVALGLPIGHAHALSCTPTGFDLAKSFNQHATSDEQIMFIRGAFSGGPKKLGTYGGEQKTWKLNFNGTSVGKSSLKPLITKVTVQSQCLSVWCGPVPQNGTAIIAAVAVQPDGQLVLNSEPCTPNQFEATQANIELLQQCMRNGTCD